MPSPAPAKQRLSPRENIFNLVVGQYAGRTDFGDSRRAESDALKLAARRDRAAELNTSLDELAISLANCEVEIAALADDAALAVAEAAAQTAAETSRTALAEAMQAESRLPIWSARQAIASLVVIKKQVHGSNVLTALAAA